MLTKVEATTVKAAENEPFIIVEQFADIKVLRYQIPGWEDLSKSRN
jgi:dipeptidyl-peptidase-3